jgi:hypothetical protein
VALDPTSKRSRFITFCHALTKSFANFSFASSAAAAAVVDAVGACGVPRHPDEEGPVVAKVSRPPVLVRPALCVLAEKGHFASLLMSMFDLLLMGQRVDQTATSKGSYMTDPLYNPGPG